MEVKEDFVFPIYIVQPVIDKLMKMCKSSELEIIGQLIGKVRQYKTQKYILITDYLYIKGAIHSDKYTTSSIEGTLGKYEAKFQNIRKKKNDQMLRRVGWWHSHPGFGCFLSSTDLETQRSVFPGEHEVALVIDPVQDYFEFFTLDNQSEKGYKALSYAIINSIVKEQK